MPDRRRTAFRHPLPERASMLMRERQSSSQGSSSSSGSSSGSPSDSSPDSSPDSSAGSSSGSPSGDAGTPGTSDDNPFAAPPADRPDQPWQPRRPSHRPGGDGDSQNNGEGDSGNGSSDERPVWGSQWSDRQPGRQNGGFGSRPGGTGGTGGTGGSNQGPDGGRKSPGSGPGGMRWDPTDPVQRRARYSVLGGMWAFFFALFDFPEIALLLGALAVYWSISALRAKPQSGSSADSDTSGRSGRATTAQITGTAGAETTATTTAPAPGAASNTGAGSRQQTTAAVSGLVTALLALAIVATTFTVQVVYRDYYTCVNDALTKTGALACNDQLPKPLEPFFGVKK